MPEASQQPGPIAPIMRLVAAKRAEDFSFFFWHPICYMMNKGSHGLLTHPDLDRQADFYPSLMFPKTCRTLSSR